MLSATARVFVLNWELTEHYCNKCELLVLKNHNLFLMPGLSQPVDN